MNKMFLNGVGFNCPLVLLGFNFILVKTRYLDLCILYINFN